MNARQIVREARHLGLDPVMHAQDLADAYGWDEDMMEDAMSAVAAIVERDRESDALVTRLREGSDVQDRHDACFGVTY